MGIIVAIQMRVGATWKGLLMLIEVYTDGSSSGNSEGPGGWAYVICVDGHKVTEGSGHLPRTTNNIAEISAAISGLEAAHSIADGVNYKRVLYRDRLNVPAVGERGETEDKRSVDDRIVLISDSQLVLKYATGEYQCRKYHLVPYYIKLRKLYKELNVETRWVRGHAGDINNERCDKLAKSAKDNPN